MNLLLTASIFAAGILSFFSPCIFPLLPAYLGILLDGNDEKKFKFLGIEIGVYSLIKTLIFVFGTSLIFVILGFGAGFIGNLFYDARVRIVLGILVVIMGLHQMELLTIRSLNVSKQVHFNNFADKGQFLKPLLLGISLSLGWSPCVGPVLGSVLALAASGGNSSLVGASYMFIYSLGFSLPFLAIALSSNFLLKHINKLKKHILLLKRIGGGLIIFIGILLIFGKLSVLNNLF